MVGGRRVCRMMILVRRLMGIWVRSRVSGRVLLIGRFWMSDDSGTLLCYFGLTLLRTNMTFFIELFFALLVHNCILHLPSPFVAVSDGPDGAVHGAHLVADGLLDKFYLCIDHSVT